MTTTQVSLEREIQLKLSDAWALLAEVVGIADSLQFGRTLLRREWVRKARALRACVLLQAGRLIDIRELESVPGLSSSQNALQKRLIKKRRSGELDPGWVDPDGLAVTRRQYALLCPLDFPDMSCGLGPAARAVAAGEAEIAPFFAVEVPELVGVERPKMAHRRIEKRKQRDAVLDALQQQDAMLAGFGTGKAVDRQSNVSASAAEMRRRAGVE
jgi:heme exporter protein D